MFGVDLEYELLSLKVEKKKVGVPFCVGIVWTSNTKLKCVP